MSHESQTSSDGNIRSVSKISQKKNLIPIDTPNKFLDVGVNPDLSFMPRDNVKFYVDWSNIEAPGLEAECDTEEEQTEEEESQPDSESEMEFEEEEPHSDKNIDDNAEIEDMKYLVFSSALKPLLHFCQICSHPAVIKRINNKGTAICVLCCITATKPTGILNPR